MRGHVGASVVRIPQSLSKGSSCTMTWYETHRVVSAHRSLSAHLSSALFAWPRRSHIDHASNSGNTGAYTPLRLERSTSRAAPAQASAHISTSTWLRMPNSRPGLIPYSIGRTVVTPDSPGSSMSTSTGAARSCGPLQLRRGLLDPKHALQHCARSRRRVLLLDPEGACAAGVLW